MVFWRDPAISALTELGEADILRKDGRRVSLEGVLTGAAFGIVFLYLLDAGQQAFAGQRQRSGGPMEGPADDGLGKFRTSVGRIPTVGRFRGSKFGFRFGLRQMI